MIHFTPTYTAKDTSKNATAFIKEHKSELWRIVKVIAPYLLIILVFTMVVQHYSIQHAQEIFAHKTETAKESSGVIPKTPEEMEAYKEEIKQRTLSSQLNIFTISGHVAQLAISYLFAVIAINWHRLVLLGPNNYQTMNMFKPKKHEIHFMGLIILTSFILPMVLSLFSFGSIMISPLFGFAVFFLSIAYIYFFYKICFLFPARAVNSDLSVYDSFHLTKGYFWKMLWAYIRASFKLMLVMFLVMVIMSLTFVPALTMSSDNNSMLLALLGLGIALPMYFYFTPLLTVIFVTILSNYYQHALQNKGLSS